MRGQRAAQGGAGLLALRLDQPAGGGIGHEVDADRFAGAPIARHLQDGGTRQAAVGEEGGLAEPRLAGAGDHLRRDAGQRGEQRLLAAQRQRHQRRPGLDHLQPESAGEIIGESGRAQFGDGRTTGGDDQLRRGHGAAGQGDAIGVTIVIDRADRRRQGIIHAARRTFVAQHRDDLLRRPVAK